MSSKTSNKLVESFRCASFGLASAFKTQRNMRIHAAIGLIVLVSSIALGVTAVEFSLLVLAITIVIGAELANTAVEGIVDMISPHRSEEARRIKDVAAASVLVAAIGSVGVGFAVLGEKLLTIGKRLIGTLLLLLLAAMLAGGFPAAGGDVVSARGTVARDAAPLDVRALAEIHFIDVGQGDSILIRTAAGGTVLVDGGEREAGEQVVVPYLKKHGIDRIDLLVASHPHSDHVGGLVPVLREFDVGRVISDGQVHTTGTYVEFLETIEAKRIPFTICRAGDRFAVPGIDEILVVNPSEPLQESLNDNSLALRLEFGEVVVFLPGDIEAGAFSRLAKTSLPLRAEVLKLPHHGGYEPGTEQFIEMVSPELAVILCGADNKYGHPDARTLRALGDVRVLRTDRDGHIVVGTDGTHFWVIGEDPGGDGNSRLDLNTATFEQLVALPGIGEVLAERIIEYRNANRFDSIEEITAVKGIGAKKFEGIKDLICVK